VAGAFHAVFLPRRPVLHGGHALFVEKKIIRSSWERLAEKCKERKLGDPLDERRAGAAGFRRADEKDPGYASWARSRGRRC